MYICPDFSLGEVDCYESVSEMILLLEDLLTIVRIRYIGEHRPDDTRNDHTVPLAFVLATRYSRTLEDSQSTKREDRTQRDLLFFRQLQSKYHLHRQSQNHSIYQNICN